MGASQGTFLKQHKSEVNETQSEENKSLEQETKRSEDLLDDTCLQTNKIITNCNSFKRINNILKQYKVWINKQQQSALSPDDGYTYDDDQKNCGFYDIISDGNDDNTYNISKMLDDFHHLLCCHSFDDIYNNLDIKYNENNEFNDKEYIYLLRNYRDRSDVSDYIDNYNELYFYSNNNKQIVIQQIMDSIYSYYLHSYFLGMKLNENEQNEYELLNDNNIMNGETKKIRFMKQIVLSKLKSVKNSDVKDNKFITKISKNENLTYSTVKPNQLYYDFGNKYYYWEKHKNNQEFYVAKKFDTLKNELTLNKVCNINLKDWNNLYEKAVFFSNKLYTKKLLRASIKRKCDEETYNIMNGSLISLNHIITIMIYCNFINLHFILLQTYRPIAKNENNKNMIQRHSNFANLGKYLFEIVHLFGNGNKKDIIFYHAINDSSNTALSTILCVKSAFSLTSSAQVIISATSMFEKGLILQLKQDENCSGSTPYFDCRSLSDFQMECEYVMIGNEYYSTLRFTNIIDIQNGYDYSHWILLYHTIKSMVNNKAIDTSKFEKITKQNVIKLLGNELNKGLLVQNDDAYEAKKKEEKEAKVKIMAVNPYLDMELMKGIEEFSPDKNKQFEEKYKKHNQHKKSEIDKFDCFEEVVLPNYMNKMFNAFCINTREININWTHLNDSFVYLFLNSLLTFNSMDMIRLDRFMKIFPNCQEVFIFGANTLKLNNKLMEYVYKFIVENRNKIKLNKINITHVAHKQGSSVIYSIAQAANKYKQKFNQINCKLDDENPKKHHESLVFEW